MKPRFYLIVGGLALIFIIIIAVVAAQAPPKSKVKESETVTITILYNVGIKSIEIINQNTGQHFDATVTSLPFSFNVTRGNAIDVTVTTSPNYNWNAWIFDPVGIPFSDNTGTFKADNTNYFGAIVVNNQIIMRPDCIHITSTPTPTPIPTETPVSYTQLVVVK